MFVGRNKAVIIKERFFLLEKRECLPQAPRAHTTANHEITIFSEFSAR